MLILPVGMYLFFLIITLIMGINTFYSNDTIMMILRRTVFYAIVAWAFSITMQAGRWDFSIGAQILLSAIIGTNLAQMWGLGLVGILGLCIICGMVLGAIYGVAYVFMRVPARVLSLGILLVYEALTAILFNSQGAKLSGEGATTFGTEPWLFVIGAVVMVIYHFAMYKTKFGFDLRSTGNGQEVALNIGVSEDKNAFKGYLFAGFILGVGAAVYMSQQGIILVTSNLTSTSIFFSSIMPVNMGLYLARFGKSSYSILFSSFAMSTLVYGLITVGISIQLQNVFTGVFIILFMTFTANQERFSAYLARRRLRKAVASGEMVI